MQGRELGFIFHSEVEDVSSWLQAACKRKLVKISPNFSSALFPLGLIPPFSSWLRNSENTICVWKDVSQLKTVSPKSTVTLWGSQFWTCDQEPLQLITSCSKQELRCKWGPEQLTALVLCYVVLVKVLRNVISSPVYLPQPLMVLLIILMVQEVVGWLVSVTFFISR